MKDDPIICLRPLPPQQHIGQWVRFARLFSPPCNLRSAGYRRTPRDTSGHVLSRTERAILWALTVAALSIFAVIIWGIFS